MKTTLVHLVENLSKDNVAGISKEDLKVACSKTFELMSEALAQGDRIEIRNFASFAVRSRIAPKDPRVSRSGESKPISKESSAESMTTSDNKTQDKPRDKCNIVYFRMSEHMKKTVDLN